MEKKKSTTTLPIPSVFMGPRRYGDSRAMTEADFSGVYAEVFTVVKDAFEKQGHFAATAFVLQVNREGKIGLAYPAALGELMMVHGSRGKTMAAAFMDHMLAMESVDFVALVTESWRAPVEPGEDPVPASWHPAREEVLMFNVMGKDCQALAACPLERDENTGVAAVSEQTPLAFVHEIHSRAEGVFIRKRATALN